jgi:uncharacterized protein (TIGR00251 family)
VTAVKGLRFRVFVQPRAGRSEIVGTRGDGIKVRIGAPPVAGAANEALITLLAESLRISRSSIRIVGGMRGRQKLIEVDASLSVACRARLEALTHTVDKSGPRR